MFIQHSMRTNLHSHSGVVYNSALDVKSFHICFRYHVAKYNLGKVRLKPMQSAVSRLSVRDLRAALWGFAGLLCIVALHVLYC